MLSQVDIIKENLQVEQSYVHRHDSHENIRLKVQKYIQDTPENITLAQQTEFMLIMFY